MLLPPLLQQHGKMERIARPVVVLLAVVTLPTEGLVAPALAAQHDDTIKSRYTFRLTNARHTRRQTRLTMCPEPIGAGSDRYSTARAALIESHHFQVLVQMLESGLHHYEYNEDKGREEVDYAEAKTTHGFFANEPQDRVDTPGPLPTEQRPTVHFSALASGSEQAADSSAWVPRKRWTRNGEKLDRLRSTVLASAKAQEIAASIRAGSGRLAGSQLVKTSRLDSAQTLTHAAVASAQQARAGERHERVETEAARDRQHRRRQGNHDGSHDSSSSRTPGIKWARQVTSKVAVAARRVGGRIARAIGKDGRTS